MGMMFLDPASDRVLMAFFDDADQKRQPEVITALGAKFNPMVGYRVIFDDALNLNFKFKSGFLFIFSPTEA